MWDDEVLANHFEGILKAIHCSIPTHIIKVCECLTRQYTNVGWVSENRRIGIYRGMWQKIAIWLKGAPNLVHELYKRKMSIRCIDKLLNMLNDVERSNEIKCIVLKWNRLNCQISTFNIFWGVITDINTVYLFRTKWILWICTTTQIKGDCSVEIRRFRN
jgi:hypothetical protein